MDSADVAESCVCLGVLENIGKPRLYSARHAFCSSIRLLRLTLTVGEGLVCGVCVMSESGVLLIAGRDMEASRCWTTFLAPFGSGRSFTSPCSGLAEAAYSARVHRVCLLWVRYDMKVKGWSI